MFVNNKGSSFEFRSYPKKSYDTKVLWEKSYQKKFYSKKSYKQKVNFSNLKKFVLSSSVC